MLTEYQHQPLWKNWKMATILLILIIQKNFNLPTPPMFGSLVFQVLTETEYQHWLLWKNWKMAAISLILIIWKKIQITDPPQCLGLWFSECWNGISALAIMKILKNDYHFINIYYMEKFQITNPPKVWVSGFLSVDRNRISALAIMKKIEKWLPFH